MNTLISTPVACETANQLEVVFTDKAFSMGSKKRYWRPAMGLALILMPTLLFLPVRHFGFAPFVNEDYAIRYSQEVDGVTFAGLLRTITRTDDSGWHPIPRLSLILDSLIYGEHAGGFHVTNLLWHVVNVLLLAATLSRLTGHFWKSVFVAALFAVHPLQVDPVTWIGGRNELLATFFGLLSFQAYARHIRQRDWRWNWIACAAFALSLMSHRTLVALPFLLLVLDYWPLQQVCWNPTREQPRTQSSGDTGKSESPVLQPYMLLVNKLPFLALAMGFVVASVVVQPSHAVASSMTTIPWTTQIGHFFSTVLLSAKQVVYPMHSVPADTDLHSTWLVTASLVVLTLTIIAVMLAGRQPWLVVGCLWFVGTLIPLIGTAEFTSRSIQQGHLYFLYLPSIGLFLAVTWLAASISDTHVFRQLVVPASALMVLGVCIVFSRDRVVVWPENVRYQATVEVTELGGTFGVDESSPDAAVIRGSLFCTEVTDAELAQLQLFTQLRTLDLSDTQITNNGLPHLKELRTLEVLKLNATKLTDSGLMHLTEMPNLHTLELGGTQVSDAGLKLLADLPRLRFFSVGFTHAHGEWLTYFSSRVALEALVFSGPQVTDESLRDIAGFSGLRWLDLSQTRITDEGLSQLKGLSRLHTLNLAATGITGIGLRHLHDQKQLHSLDLRWTPITDASLKNLAKLSRLRTLFLDSTQVGDRGLEYLQTVKSLDTLTLAYTRVTDRGLKYVEKLKRLRTLSLGGNSITDEGLKHLYGLSELEKLDLSLTRITASGIQALGQQLPHATITR